MFRKPLFFLMIAGGLGGAAVLYPRGGNPLDCVRETLLYRVSAGLDGRKFRDELEHQGCTILKPFVLPKSSTSLCDLGEPIFPSSVQPLEWFFDAELNVHCYDGAIENESYPRVCFQESSLGMIVHAAIAEISLDGRAGTWTGGLLPEDWSGLCSDVG